MYSYEYFHELEPGDQAPIVESLNAFDGPNSNSNEPEQNCIDQQHIQYNQDGSIQQQPQDSMTGTEETSVVSILILNVSYSSFKRRKFIYYFFL